MRGSMERGWVKIVGQREKIGRLFLYATTKEFLRLLWIAAPKRTSVASELPDLKSLDLELPIEEVDQHEEDKVLNH